MIRMACQVLVLATAILSRCYELILINFSWKWKQIVFIYSTKENKSENLYSRS